MIKIYEDHVMTEACNVWMVLKIFKEQENNSGDMMLLYCKDGWLLGASREQYYGDEEEQWLKSHISPLLTFYFSS